MIKIFLTGDNHIGLSYSKYGDKADFLASCRLDAFKDMAEKAAQEQCDIFAIAGDLFHNNYGVSEAEIDKIINYLSAFHGKILILPGNHDYCGEGINLWRDFEDKANGRIDCTVMTEYKTFKFNIRGESVIIYPACCKTEHSERGKNNLGWIKAFFNHDNSDLNSAYKIGMAHGSIKGVSIDNDERYFMMTRDELNNIPVDLWLIGHTHVPYPQSLSTEFETMREKIFNAGSHMQTDVADKNSEGQCFIIELDKSGADNIDDKKIIRAKKFLSGPVRFYRLEENISGQTLEKFLSDEIINIKNNSVIELILSGFLSREDFENRAAIIKELFNRFECYKYDEREVMPIIDKEILSEFPKNSFIYKFLNNIISDDDSTREEAYMAYSLIKSIN